MKIELLESRIAPAGIVTLSIVGTTLKVVGDDAANVFNVTQLADGSVRFDASTGTQLRFGDNLQTQVRFTSAEGRSMSFELFAGADEVVIAGLSLFKDLKVDAGAGADVLSFQDILLDGKMEIKGGPGANTVNLGGTFAIEGTFSYLGFDEADALFGATEGFAAAGLTLDMKGGDNVVKWDDATGHYDLLRSPLVVRGASGSDSVEISGYSASLGALTVDLGGGVNQASVLFGDITISGGVVAKGGGDSDAFTLVGTNSLTVRKGVSVDVGDGAAAVEIAGGQNLRIVGNTAVIFGKTTPSPAETASFKLGGRDVHTGGVSMFSDAEWFAECIATISGYVDGVGVDSASPARSVRMGALSVQGASEVTVNAADALVVRGTVGITVAPGASSSKVSLSALTMDFGSNFRVLGLPGDLDFMMSAESIEIAGNLTLNLGDTGTHEVGFGLVGGSLTAASIAVARGKSLAGSTLNLNVAGRVETTNAFSVLDGAGAVNVQFTDVDLDIGKTFSLVLGDGDADVSMNGGAFYAGGEVSYRAGWPSGESVDMIGFRSVNIEAWTWSGGLRADTGVSQFSFEATSGSIGSMSINLGAGANNANIESTGALRIGKLTYASQSGVGAVLDRMNVEGVVVREISANLGLADSILNIARSRVGKLSAKLGAGADIVRLDDNTFTGAVGILGELGADSIRIDRDTDFASESHFLGAVVLALGGGDDELLVANVDAETKANFYRAVTVDGGAGTDTFTPHATNAVFAIAAILSNVE